MSFGLDYVTGPPIATMKAAGVTFVCRYLSQVNPQTRVKILTRDEANALSQAGISIVSNYEWYANRALEGAAAGVADAHIAVSQHIACGGSANAPLYFSVDVDVEGIQVFAYFKGVASVIGTNRTGAYGSYKVLHSLFDNSLIRYGWQTYAWSGGAWESRAHIQQYQNGMNMAGHSVDYNRAIKPDYGQWIIGGGQHMPIPQNWKDDGHTLTSPNGHRVVLGFRDHIMAAPAWESGNEPQEEEYHTGQVLLHNAPLGAGQRQTFRDTLLWFTQEKGVVQEPYLGLEIKACYDEIAALQAEVAKLKATAPVVVPSGLNIVDALSQLHLIQASAGSAATALQAAIKDLGGD